MDSEIFLSKVGWDIVGTTGVDVEAAGTGVDVTTVDESRGESFLIPASKVLPVKIAGISIF